MKVPLGNTQEQQKKVVQNIQQESSSSDEAIITDNRPAIAVQRKLKSVISSSEKITTPIQRKPTGSSRFQKIALKMGRQYGLDTSSLRATHNSPFPGTLNAEATIQGKNIHFAPGKDTTENMKHEVAHAIDNTLHGTPKGDTTVNGYKVDTTREKTVDRMISSNTSIQRKDSKNVVSNSFVIQRRVVNSDAERNQEAATNTEDYVYENAENNWFNVLDQYRAGHLNYDPQDRGQLGYVNGMNRLLFWREYLTNQLLVSAKEPVMEREKNERKKFLKTTSESANFYNEAKKNIFINEPIRPLKGNLPGSTNPTSDIDVNLSGDGTEYAVKWLNARFKRDYGNGRESGVVYDVNFYAQDFVPKKVFGLKKSGALDKTDDEKYYQNDTWRVHQMETPNVKALDEEEQEIASLLMMRVNMNENDWNSYTNRLNDINQNGRLISNKVLSEVQKRYSDRDRRLQQNNNGNANLPSNLAKIAPENREYEKVLEDEVTVARLRFQYYQNKLKKYPRDNFIRLKTDQCYKELKAAKSKALGYANEAYYTQGAVIGVVVNKQMLDNMYKDDRSTKFLKLKLTPAEYYHGFTEQIGFAFHSLNAAENMDDLIPMGKYVHRAYNLFKHYCLVTGKDYKRYFSEKERRAASNWGRSQQGKHYNFVTRSYEDSNLKKDTELWAALKKYFGTSIWYLGVDRIKEEIKKKLLHLKIEFDKARREP